jgi:hypothetical protein
MVGVCTKVRCARLKGTVSETGHEERGNVGISHPPCHFHRSCYMAKENLVEIARVKGLPIRPSDPQENLAVCQSSVDEAGIAQHWICVEKQ